MDKIIIILLFLTIAYPSCEQSKNVTMNIPNANIPDTNTIAPLLKVQKGLGEALQAKDIVFEQYIQTYIRNATASRLYANGDYYKIYLHNSDNLYNDGVSWEKVGVLSEKGLKKIQEISNSSVMDFIKDNNYEIKQAAIATIEWYFYFDTPKYVLTQNKRMEFFCWQKPKFVCKIDKTIEKYLVYESNY